MIEMVQSIKFYSLRNSRYKNLQIIKCEPGSKTLNTTFTAARKNKRSLLHFKNCFISKKWLKSTCLTATNKLGILTKSRETIPYINNLFAKHLILILVSHFHHCPEWYHSPKQLHEMNYHQLQSDVYDNYKIAPTTIKLNQVCHRNAFCTVVFCV